MQYPEDSLQPLFYKYIHKFEKLKIKTLSDKSIKSHIEKGKEIDFDDAIATLKTYCQCSPSNLPILNYRSNYQGQLITTKEFHFESRTNNSTFINDLLRHIRNSLVHARYEIKNGYYELSDYESRRLTAFGFIKEEDMLKLINAFV